MEPELWRQIEDLFHRALEVDKDLRGQFLQKECGDNQELRHEIESLLALDSQSANLFDSSTVENVKKASPNQETIIGPYRLISLIGEGGMGEVWLAEQKAPVHRRVALKLIKAGMDTKEWTARFQSERQALAMMDHPAIAKVFDAGTSPDSRPYFVMEYVPGLPITTYCDQKKLTVRQRLELFTLVCEGVQHAHQKAIIHRDLKPSNILITEIDGKAMPRIIDFGVAKAISRQFDVQSFVTSFGSVIGTLGYMSPEQADTAGTDIDIRSDVYSLGVILYELLAGALPLDLYRLAYNEVLRRLREQDPPSPSTKVRSLPPPPADTAQNRGVDASTLVRQLRGDPDAIALKALEKDRDRRYSTASDLACDIRRYLKNEPVTAHPPSSGYRARKYIRRHRALVFSLATVFVALAAGAWVSTWEAIRARRAGMRAEQEAASAQAVVDFLEHDLLAQASSNKQSGPQTRPDPDLKVRVALDRAAQGIHGKFEKEPEVEASIRYTIGDAYSDLGLLPEARAQVEHALELRQHAFGANSIEALQTSVLLAIIAQHQGKLEEAERICLRNVDTSRRVLGPEHRMTLTAMGNLTAIYLDEGKFAQEEAIGSQTLEISRRVLGPEHPLTINTMTNLATAYNGEGKYAQAEALFGQNLEVSRRVLGPEHTGTLNIMQDLAVAYSAQGKFAQSEDLDKQVLDVRMRIQGPEHPDTLNSMNNLATDYVMQGKYRQAETLLFQTLVTERRVMGPEHPDTLGALGNLADVDRLLGKYPQAKSLYSEALSMKRRILGPEHPDTLTVVSGLASLYQSHGQIMVAEMYAAQALAGYRHAKGSEDPDTMSAALDLALAYLSERRFVDSEGLDREALQTYSKIQPDGWQRYYAECLLGAALTGEKRYTEAEPLLLSGYAGMEARKTLMGAPNRYHLDQAQKWVISIHDAGRKAGEIR